ncbi:MAG: hypothetical protein KGY50_03020 [Candidatus Thermoplasmatota archaeon]|nr:hypothetical protein [Candidatus Thermoplasmatota archaeon]
MRHKYLVGICLLSCFLLSTSFILNIQASEFKKEIKVKKVSSINSIFSKILGLKSINLNTSLIDELTWAVLRYDNDCNSGNYGLANMPKPDAGSVLIPSNMMTIEACRTALSIYQLDKMETLLALEAYALEHIAVPFYANHEILTMMVASMTSLPLYAMRKNAADEMSIWGESPLNNGDIVGDCYSQAVFNTAVLRLCGFSADEVYTVLIPMHAVCVVQVNETWYVFDSVAAEDSGHAIYEILPVPGFMQSIHAIENDKYFINFGRGHPNGMPYLEHPFSNMDAVQLTQLIDQMIPMFNNATLGEDEWNISHFIKTSTPCPEILTKPIPLNVFNASGSTVEDKSLSLVGQIESFVFNQSDENNLNQYDRAVYSHGLLSVDLPQVYANAAKYGFFTSWFARILDCKDSSDDVHKILKMINFLIENDKHSMDNQVYFSDFTYRMGKGSSVDKAVLSYGTLRNMKKDSTFWQPENLFVLITAEYQGYLAVNLDETWNYLSFDNESLISDTVPDSIMMVFNEIDYFDSWDY